MVSLIEQMNWSSVGMNNFNLVLSKDAYINLITMLLSWLNESPFDEIFIIFESSRIVFNYNMSAAASLDGWLFGLNGPLRQYFSLYQAVALRESEKAIREMIVVRKNVHQAPIRNYCKRSSPLPYYNPN